MSQDTKDFWLGLMAIFFAINAFVGIILFWVVLAAYVAHVLGVK